MPKSLHTRQYTLLLQQLRNTRQVAGLTQAQLAQRLAMTQSEVSKCERGTRRLDLIELRAWCQALGTSLGGFAAQLDHHIQADALLNAPLNTPPISPAPISPPAPTATRAPSPTRPSRKPRTS